jgi:hypothetical protein
MTGRKLTEGLAFRRILFIAVCLAGCLGQSCAAPPTTTRIACGFCETPERFVRLQAHPAHAGQDGQRRFAHPLRLSPEDWKPVLASVHIQPKTQRFLFLSVKGEETPAFTPEEIVYLSTTLSKAFAQALPSEWVVFGLTRRGPPEITEVITGGWYADGPRLHLVLANYRAAVTMPNIHEVLERDPLFEVVGSGTYELVPGDFAKDERGQGFALNFLKPELQHLAIDYQRLLASPSERPQPAPSSAEERLEALKRMREKNLITEDDYKVKKKQILESF